MSQSFTDDCFAAGHAALDDLQYMENNFAALKSSFSGASDPANPIAGLMRLNTSTHRLGIRDEANAAYQEMWDMANSKPIIANLSNEITGAMISSAIKDAAAGTASLRTLGTGAQQAMPGNTLLNLKSQVFTSSGTWICPSGCSSVVVMAVGGGGGGGGACVFPEMAGMGGTGGAGGKIIGSATVSGNVTVTIGAGGAGGAAGYSTSGSPGSAGGATSFGTMIVANGGGGGAGGPYGGGIGADGTPGTNSVGAGGTDFTFLPVPVGGVGGVKGGGSTSDGGAGTAGSLAVLWIG